MDAGVGGIAGISRGHIMYCRSTGTINFLGAGGGICGFSDHYVKYSCFIGKLIQRGMASSFGEVLCGGGIIRITIWTERRIV